MIEVKPIHDEEPGWCDIATCADEAVVIAAVPLPGGKMLHPRLCRLDWAEVVAAELLDMRKLRTEEAPDGTMTLRAYPPMRDND